MTQKKSNLFKLVLSIEKHRQNISRIRGACVRYFLSTKSKRLLIQIRSEGYTYGDIMQHLNVSSNTLYRWLKEAEMTGTKMNHKKYEQI